MMDAISACLDSTRVTHSCDHPMPTSRLPASRPDFHPLATVPMQGGPEPRTPAPGAPEPAIPQLAPRSRPASDAKSPGAWGARQRTASPAIVSNTASAPEPPAYHEYPHEPPPSFTEATGITPDAPPPAYLEAPLQGMSITEGSQPSMDLLSALQSGDLAHSGAVLDHYLSNRDFYIGADLQYGGAELAILRSVAANGGVAHIDRLLASDVRLDLGRSDFLTRVVADNSSATRLPMVERLLAHDPIGRDAAGLARPLAQAAERGLMDETRLLLAQGAKQRTQAKAVALDAGHIAVALMIQRDIDARPRDVVWRFLGGLGD